MAIIAQSIATTSPTTAVSASPSSESPQTSLFIIYMDGNSKVENQVYQSLNSYGLAGSLTGSLLSVNVPNGTVKDFKQSLSNINGLSWTCNNNPVVMPMLSPAEAVNGSLAPVSFGPKTIARAYDFNWLYDHGINGHGITIGIVDAYGDPNIRYDVYAFDSVNHIAPVNLTIKYANNQVPLVTNNSWALETATDVEWAHSMAPGANIILIVAANASALALQGAVSYAVDKGLANVLSLSWGIAESELGNQTVQMYSNIYKQASERNITVLAASGDSGAFDGTKQLTVNFPASNPYVTGVGGTYLYNSSGVWKQSAWGGSNGGTNSFGSGGGYSQYFTNQSWEVAPGFSGNYRGVPDVSMIASTYSPVYIISQGLPRAIGGTSVATPIWAAVTALLKEKCGVNFGSINPLLYQISRTEYYNYSFTQILPPGNNGYYSVTPGWNPVTGLGTPIVSNLANVTTDILEGYGTAVKFLGKSYNATGISGLVSLDNRAYMPGNGTTLGFVGLYGNSTSYAILGLAVSNDTQYLKLMLREGNVSYEHAYHEITLSSSGQISAELSLNYTGNAIIAKYDNQTITSLPVFLSFSGNASPSVGVWQEDSGTNFTYLSGVSISAIQEYLNGTPVTTSVEKVVPFSYMDGYNSTILTKNSTNSVNFSYGTQKTVTSSISPKPVVMYSLSFTDPVIGSFFIPSDSQSHLRWYVNGNPQSSGTIPFSHSGYYNVSANLSSGMIAYRTVYIPNVTSADLDIADGLDYAYHLNSTVVIDYLYSYLNPSKIVVFSGQNNIQIATPGFANVNKNTTNKSINITLTPMDVNVSLFVDPAGSVVTFNGTAINGMDGLYYSLEKPSSGFDITVRLKGFSSFYLNTTLSPGVNISRSVYLRPTNSSWVELYGNVSDALFGFGIGGVMVSLNNVTSAYTNSTGYYALFYKPGQYNITAEQSLYKLFYNNTNLSSSKEYNIVLTPLNVSLTDIFKIRILSDIPFMFYFSYISWSTYKGPGFESYQLYISNNPSFTGGNRVVDFSSNTTGSTYLTGILPGHTYYIVVVLRLANGVFYESQIVTLNYSNFLWLGITILIYSTIVAYAGVAYYVFRRHKRKDEIQI